jgi:hypothetical protein
LLVDQAVFPTCASRQSVSRRVAWLSRELLMKRTIDPSSRARWVAAFSLGLATTISLTRFTADNSGLARAACAGCIYQADHGRFPPLSRYQSTGSTGFAMASVPIELLSLELVGPSDPSGSAQLPPPGGSSTDNGFFDVFTELRMGPGSPPFHIDSFFDITYRVDGGGGGGVGGLEGNWPIEILALSIKGPGPGSEPITIRESPTLASAGELRSTFVADGFYRIDSFFDVFTEISLDGGQTFHAANSALRLTLSGIVPEPGTMVLVAMWLAGCGLVARRRAGGS